MIPHTQWFPSSVLGLDLADPLNLAFCFPTAFCLALLCHGLWKLPHGDRMAVEMMVKALASWVLPAGALVNHGGCESSPGEHRHHFWFQEGPLSNPFSNTFPLHGGPKRTEVQNWTLNRLNPVPPSPPMHLLQLRCSCRNATTQHRLGNKRLEQGKSQLRLQKSYQFQVPTNPKLAPCTCLS